jgi:hypothetical protein
MKNQYCVEENVMSCHPKNTQNAYKILMNQKMNIEYDNFLLPFMLRTVHNQRDRYIWIKLYIDTVLPIRWILFLKVNLNLTILFLWNISKYCYCNPHRINICPNRRENYIILIGFQLQFSR